MIICEDCGNTEEFTRTAYYREMASETHIIDGKTEQFIDDRGDYECYDSEFVDYNDETCCEKCNSINTCYIHEEHELLIYKAKHTGKRGKWYKKELPESKWNTKLLKEAVAIKI